MDKIRKSQCFEPPKPSGTQKKRFLVKSNECSRCDEPVAKLKSWNTLCPFVATEVADEFAITGTKMADGLTTVYVSRAEYRLRIRKSS